MKPPNIDDNDRASTIASMRHNKLLDSLLKDLKGTNTRLISEEGRKEARTQPTTRDICPVHFAVGYAVQIALRY